MDRNETSKRDANRDPITGEPGSHPVGTGVGTAAGGMAAGAAAGAVAGPAGAVAGAVIGGVAGGLAGKAVAEKIDPTREDEYWKDNYTRESYYDKSLDYEDYSPAYRTGYMGRGQYGDRGFDDVEGDLRKDYENSRGRSKLSWDRAKFAARAAWARVGSDRH